MKISKFKSKSQIRRIERQIDWNTYRDQFVRETLRKASFRWPPRTMAFKAARTVRDMNPKTDRLCWYVRCAICSKQIIEKEAKLDHISPVVPVVPGMRETVPAGCYSKINLGPFVFRMFPETAGYQVLCKECHARKTETERSERAAHRKRERRS